MGKTVLEIVKLLASEYKQSEISVQFKKNEITPNSISIIEKIKKKYKVKTNFHLALLLNKEGIV